MSYTGDIDPTEAFRLLTDDPDAVLVDCRTNAEWSYVGTPDLSSIQKRTIFIEWQQFPSGQVNPRFVDQLEDAGVTKSQPIAFLCRSGARSKAAAAAAVTAGYATAYNVTEGFEGPADESGHRGTTSGWKVAGLPWRQP
jgi:rhodanese-related sulfurtransferase